MYCMGRPVSSNYTDGFISSLTNSQHACTAKLTVVGLHESWGTIVSMGCVCVCVWGGGGGGRGGKREWRGKRGKEEREGGGKSGQSVKFRREIKLCT